RTGEVNHAPTAERRSGSRRNGPVAEVWANQAGAERQAYRSRAGLGCSDLRGCGVRPPVDELQRVSGTHHSRLTHRGIPHGQLKEVTMPDHIDKLRRSQRKRADAALVPASAPVPAEGPTQASGAPGAKGTPLGRYPNGSFFSRLETDGESWQGVLTV